MRLLPALLAVLAALPLSGAGAADPVGKKNFIVHEWGVWRVHQDVELANADLRDIWDNLPRFVHGQIDGRNLPRYWRNIEISDRPIIFFHTPDAFTAQVKIDFPRGAPGVWWPATRYPAIESFRGVRMPEIKKEELARRLEWHLHLRAAPPLARGGAPIVEEKVADGHWFSTLRKVDAVDVFAPVGEARFGCEREKFVYYDGLLPRGKWAVLEIEKGTPRLSNPASFPLLDITLVDRREAGKVRVGRLARLESGTRNQAIELRAVEAGRWPREGADVLLGQLKLAGLFADEAGSLADLWEKDLLQADGLTLFYRFPQEEYDRQLPLTLTPRAEKLVRVGLAVHPHCEPDFAERIAGLVRDLGSEDFGTREKAESRLREMGRAAYGQLSRLRKSVTEPEARLRLNRLLKRLEAPRLAGG